VDRAKGESHLRPSTPLSHHGADARRRPIRVALTVVALLVAAAILGPGANAAHANNFQECTPIKGPTWIWPPNNYVNSDLYQAKISSNLYESFVINYSCNKARSAILKLINETLPNTTAGAQNQLLSGQPGGIQNFTCIAYADANARAYGGECRSGSVRFAWNYNVIWHGVPGTSTGEAGAGFEPMAEIEYDTVLTPLGNGAYKLVVTDASGIGSIDAFTWNGPPQLTITGVTGSSGSANCQFAGGAISCQGKLAPPVCLCSGSGGSVTIYFNATGAAPTMVQGHQVNQGLSWSYLHITAMTPVPHLIPDAVQQVKNNL
jgi:hypothetical protein